MYENEIFIILYIYMKNIDGNLIRHKTKNTSKTIEIEGIFQNVVETRSDAND